MRVALFVSSGTYADWYNYPLLGPCYLKAVLQQAGHECVVFDPRFHRWPKGELVKRIIEYRPDVVGLSAMTHEISSGAEIAQEVQRTLPQARMIVGGCHATALPQRTVEEFRAFDYLVHGEGEKTLPELLARMGSGNESQVAGIAFVRDGVTVVTPGREYLTGEELDALPYPALDDY
jgi:radical SAM superfamily enzyme YgiQ (UPF0313 family)